MNELSRTIRRAALVPTVGFALLCVLLGYWQLVRAPGLRADEHNSRAQDRLRLIQPGRLYDADGDLLMGVERTARGYQRTYPAGRYVCHLTGYNDRSGLQWGLREAFLGIGRYEKPWAEFVEGPLQGNDVVLTIDLDAQQLATRLLRGKRGAVVALGAQTGAVLALVSAPAYDPDVILSSKWDYQLFREDPDSPELNRALQGLYPPGSTLKIMTAAIALDLGRVTPDTTFKCDGKYKVDGAEITCPRPHGTVTLQQALAVSCNTTFARLGTYIAGDEFASYVERFRLLEPAQMPLPSAQGRMGELGGSDGAVLLAETAFGQGKTLVTPLAIARLTLALAKGGTVLEPYMVDSVRGPDGRVRASARARVGGQAVSPAAAARVAGMMVRVVEEGTGRVAQLPGIEVAGKTGSAENPHGEPHSWFTGFAPADDPQVVVTAVVENAGAGAEAAAPIVREVMAYLLDRAGVREAAR
ncbi:MAG: peptidoglycan D,D-transpeptidase FtsI family protein [Armatimonadota bacterium]